MVYYQQEYGNLTKVLRRSRGLPLASAEQAHTKHYVEAVVYH